MEAIGGMPHGPEAQGAGSRIWYAWQVGPGVQLTPQPALPANRRPRRRRSNARLPLPHGLGSSPRSTRWIHCSVLTCGAQMNIVAVIMDPVEVDKILAYLLKTGRAPPELRAPSLT